MAEISVQRILLLVVSLTKCLKGTELLAHLKKCGDLECETLISRVLALRDHTGPDCRYLNFTEGEEISVYVKLAGEREDLWAGSKGKDFGFFPRDAVKIEEVFISEEVEMPTKESDFLCLLGEGYIFGSEHSELISGDDENMYPYENDEDQKYDIQGDFQPEPDFYTEFEGTLFEEQISAPETPEDFRISSVSNGWKEAGNAGSGEQGYTPDWDQALPSLSVPEKQGWFGLRREEAEEKPFEPDTEPAQESSFQSRKLTVEEENDLEKLNNGEPQVELEQDPKSQLDSEAPETSSVLEEQYELSSESEHVLKPEANAWFGGGFTSYLGFGKEDTGLELLSEESNPPLEDGPNSVPLDEEAPPPSREISTDKEETVINDSSVLSPSWFYFGFGMLGFAQTNKDGTTSDNGESEDGGGDSHTYPIASDFDPEKKEERETIAAVETEDQTGKESPLEKKGDSGSMLYLKKFFDNPWSFQNLPEDTESPFSKQILGQEAIVENDKTEKLSTENSPTDRTKDPMMMESRHSPSDMASEIESSLRVHEGIHLKISSSKRNEEDSRSCVDSEVPAVAESDSTVEDALLGVQLVSQAKHVYGFMNSALSPAEILIESVVAALPDDMRADFNPNGFSLELAICVLTIGLLAVLLFLWRGFRSIQSRFYVGREKKLALELSALIEEKCKLLEKVSLVEKEYEGLESSLKEASFEKESTEAQSLEATYENLERSRSKLEEEIILLEKNLEEERAKHSEQDELMADISKRIQSLEDESKSLKAQVAETKTTFKIFEINEERLKGTIKDALNENSELQESQKQLLQKAEVMKEQVNELEKQKVTFEESKVQVEQLLNDKENQIKTLIESLLKMKDWAAVLGEDIADDDNLDLEVKGDLGNNVHLDNQPKGALKKLIYAAKLNASLKALEGERNQIYTQLSEVDKTKEDLTERIKNLESEQASLQSENTQFESENQKLQEKLKVMTELYQDNEMKLHRKLTVEENCLLEKEEKLSKVDERISRATEELETCKQRVKDLEEELERTIHSYQGQVISHEKKAHDNWLAARTFERNLNDLRKENALNRQKLTETEFKLELLEKDPYALDVPNAAFGREHSPYGPSPLGRPSSETRAFLSPPTLLEGPLRFSPLLPGGGGRGSRGPENLLDHQMNTERRDSGYDRLSDAPRAPSDRSLSPPWEQDRRMIALPPGQPYSDPALQRQDRFYSNSGRLSGPAELRSYNMHSLDKVDGQVSSEMESSRNDTKDDLGNSNVPDSPPHVECKAAGGGFVPPPVPPPFPPVRDPLFPVDPRSQFMRRAPPFLPPPPGNMYADPRDYFPPRDFHGPPLPPFPGRNMYAPRSFPPYLPPRPRIFPPFPHPESRSERAPDLIPPSKEPAAEPAETQET
ncbi:melanoma inhibitory activity protein 2 isoform X2 [Meriones unguiculatus]|uniref:melanoma inhibitory activity protein 2 isoform X2 n=2 Tax=Meriones unguiculatus TaxID=10047 RepID=UPI000B4ED805|nr:melanoma inhibitory activity protein 2 isoform X2 [Meriones unguiculatus]